MPACRGAICNVQAGSLLGVRACLLELVTETDLHLLAAHDAIPRRIEEPEVSKEVVLSDLLLQLRVDYLFFELLDDLQTPANDVDVVACLDLVQGSKDRLKLRTEHVGDLLQPRELAARAQLLEADHGAAVKKVFGREVL